MQTPLPAVSQVTTVPALTLHLYGSALVSQNSVPLHKLPSSWLAQSAFTVQPQEFAPLVQVPPEHTSPTVQPFPSSQALVLLTWVQPLSALQASLVHGLPSSQNVATTTAVPVQDPPPQVSFWVHALLSLHASALLLCAQPVPGEHESLVQMLPSSQFTLLPAQTPPLQTSFWLQALPSLQVSALLAKTQAPVAELHESVVHGLLSLHTATAPGLHAPVAQISPTVQALPSVHGLVLFVCWQPALLLQVSLVQGLPSSQLRLAPAAHTPFWQVSGLVHTLESALHAPP